MSWIYALSRVFTFMALGIITFALCLHAMYAWGLTTAELSYLAIILAGLGVAGTRLPRRYKTPDIKLPANHRPMNRTNRKERVFTEHQFEQLRAAIFDKDQEPRP